MDLDGFLQLSLLRIDLAANWDFSFPNVHVAVSEAHGTEPKAQIHPNKPKFRATAEASAA